MATAILFGQTAAENPLPNRSAAALEQTLVKAGYEVTKKSATSTVVTKRGSRGEITLRITDSRLQGPRPQPDQAVFVSFVAQFRFPRPVDVTPPVDFTPDLVASQPIHFASHVGDFTSADSSISVGPKMTESEFLQRTHAVWEAISDYSQKNRLTPEPQDMGYPHLTPEVNQRVLAYADYVSLAYLVDFWGWRYNGPWGGSSNGWMFPISLGSSMVWLHEAVNDHDVHGKGFLVQETVTLQHGAPEEWIKARKLGDQWWFGATGEHDVVCSHLISLADRPTAAVVRDRILAFHKLVSDLPR